MPKAEDLARRLKRRILHLAEKLDHLLKSHAAGEADIARVTELVARGFPSADELDATLAKLTLSDSVAFKTDKRIDAARRLLARVLTTRAELQSLDETYGRAMPDLLQRAIQLNENRQRLLVSLQCIHAAKLSPTSVALPDHVTAARRWLEAINLSGDLAEKANAVLGFLRRLSGM